MTKEQELFANMIAFSVRKRVLACLAKDKTYIELVWNGERSYRVALQGPIVFETPKEPETIDLKDLIASTLPGMWGYMNNDPGFQTAKVCTHCGKVVKPTPP